MDELRGKIVEITFHVEYPDGLKKISKFIPEKRLNAILLSENFMTQEMKGQFNISDCDWKKNPAMIIVDGEILKANCDYPECRQA